VPLLIPSRHSLIETRMARARVGCESSIDQADRLPAGVEFLGGLGCYRDFRRLVAAAGLRRVRLHVVSTAPEN
jgi:hypothetical protein